MINNRTGAAVALFALILIVCFCVGCTVDNMPGEDVTAEVTLLTESKELPVEQVPADTAERPIKPTEPEPTITLISEPLLFSNISYEVFYDIARCKDFVAEVNKRIQDLERAIKSEEYSQEAVSSMEAEHARLLAITKKVEADIAKYTTWERDYYYATRTFLFLKQCGYSDVVACAIIGNMMIETSGGSLALNPTIYDPPREYYGLCQWSLYYKPFMADKTFEEQLEYLHTDMKSEFKMFSFCYASGFSYEAFLAMEDPAEAALAFAKVYERCGSGSYNLRKQAAVKAYNYFCS